MEILSSNKMKYVNLQTVLKRTVQDFGVIAPLLERACEQRKYISAIYQLLCFVMTMLTE